MDSRDSPLFKRKPLPKDSPLFFRNKKFWMKVSVVVSMLGLFSHPIYLIFFADCSDDRQVIKHKTIRPVWITKRLESRARQEKEKELLASSLEDK